MRATILALCFAFAAACGSSDGDDLTGPDGSTNPTTNPPSCDVYSAECMACAQALTADSAACAVDPQACTEMQDVEIAVMCFTNEGQCQKAALGKAASCHRACCDVEQANVETCTGECFVARADCQVSALRRFDACYMLCNDPFTCALCDAEFNGDSNDCGMMARRCADICVMTHRKS